MLTEQELVQVIAGACLDEKASGVVILDVNELTIIADYFVVASARSQIQVQSIIKHVEEKLGEYEIYPVRTEGRDQGVWAVMDYSSTILHVFRQEEREYYDLENLWGDARKISLDENMI